jgi:hypothetical protein
MKKAISIRVTETTPSTGCQSSSKPANSDNAPVNSDQSQVRGEELYRQSCRAAE